MSQAPRTSQGLPESADVVVIGAGHNGLVCAAYLAAAGLSVVVLEARDIPGGNTVTEELTLPGFAHDSCSSAHVLIQSNPLIRDDELGLIGTYGLDYILTDPAVVMPQGDGEGLIMHRDLDATVAEIARWSRRDADTFRAMHQEWSGGLATMHGRWSSALPLGDSDSAKRYLSRREQSAWDVVHETYENDVVRSFVLWMAMATIQDPRRPGTGFLPQSLAAGRLSFGWATPRGGSIALPQALIRQLEDHGGQAVMSAPVSQIEVEGGRARAVRTTDGRRIEARHGIVSSAHLAQLAGMITGAGVPAELTDAQDRWQPGISVFAVHAALKADLRFHTHHGPMPSAAGGFGSATGMARQLDAFYRGEVDPTDPWLLVVNQTAVDHGRAPDGQATFKILTIAPYDLADGRDWAEAKEDYGEALLARVRAGAAGLDESDILAVRYESPHDVAAHNLHNLGGSCHGGEFRIDDGGVIPGWPSYATPSLDGLYLTGATTHPGGSVSGRPGRNAARFVLTQLGLDPSKVMGEN
ncbi:MAG TPA: NAD(P)/FAD-dependent oxidoreductase [Jiangellaceae bacterium]|nr:NAD(P)/FAD-dependent oxidoreductase [Jiangellaceae bacterium]